MLSVCKLSIILSQDRNTGISWVTYIHVGESYFTSSRVLALRRLHR